MPPIVKTLVTAGLAGAAMLLWTRTPMGPAPIAWGRDTCAACHNAIERTGFAGEIRRPDGSVTKYDDVGCLVRALLARPEDAATAWVQDHATGAFIPLRRANLVSGDAVSTPMGSGLVAFAAAWRARRYADARQARVLGFEDLVRDTTLSARLVLPEAVAPYGQP